MAREIIVSYNAKTAGKLSNFEQYKLSIIVSDIKAEKLVNTLDTRSYIQLIQALEKLVELQGLKYPYITEVNMGKRI